MKKTLYTFLSVLMLTSVLFGQARLTTRLKDELRNAKAQEYVSGLVFLSDQVDAEAIETYLTQIKAAPHDRAVYVVKALQQKASETQPLLETYFAQKYAERKVFTYKPFWIVNMFVIEAMPSVFFELAADPLISMIDFNAPTMLDKPLAGNTIESPESVQQGVRIIRAPEIWRLGFTGQGTIVMSEDTGVHGTHEALAGKWRGSHVPWQQAWLDPVSHTSSPSDCDGHGSHTTGTMVGVRPNGDTLGVAPGAEWIAAKTICSGDGTANHFEAYQWAANPDGDVNTTTDIPIAINNSWYDPDATDECTGPYVQLFQNTEAVGIGVVFSAGNNGSGPSTITPPKNINYDLVSVFSVGAIDGTLYLGGNNNPIASFSSRGPSICGGSGSLLIKPEVSAPGVNVFSCDNGNTLYQTISGTSMASPHVTGSIALLKSAFPNYTGAQIKLALYLTAHDLGTAGEDNNYGMGLIDLVAAYNFLANPDTDPPAPIDDLTADVLSYDAAQLDWTAVGSDGNTGTASSYDIRYSTAGPITDLNFLSATQVPNPPAPSVAGTAETFTVTGLTGGMQHYFAIRVYDLIGNHSISNSPSVTTFEPPVMIFAPTELSATLYENATITQQITIQNTGVDALTFSFPDFSVKKILAEHPEYKPAENTYPNLELGKDDADPRKGDPPMLGAGGPDAFGYTWIDSDAPGGPTFSWVDIAATGTAISGLGDDGSATVTLPWQFPFYGTNYGTIYVGANGYFSFVNAGMGEYTNASIPNGAVPNSLIAMMWDDLNPGGSGATSTVRYFNDTANNRFIISFINVIRYGSTSRYTAQLILTPDGTMTMQYLTMQGTYLSQMTIGIENQTGTVGLQTVFNAAYMHDNLALRFAAAPDFITDVSPVSGELLAGQSVTVDVTYSSEGLDPDVYDEDLVLLSNDPLQLSTNIPNQLTVLSGAGASIPFELGWNIFSSAYTPAVVNMRQFMDPLIAANQLIKVQNESGQALEFIAGNWINNIGNWLQTEGYYTKVNANTDLSFSGTTITGTINIPLNTGWNIMSYPTQYNQDALVILNNLITANQLVKVLDENGNPIENLQGIGWINLIGNMKTGEGYLIRVNANTSVNINTAPPTQPNVPSAEIAKHIIESFNLKTGHFIVKQTTNPYRPMNIYITGFDALNQGGEIGIYDGSLLVGSAVIGSSGIVPVILRMDDPTTEAVDGFVTGNPITVKLWNGAAESLLQTELKYAEGLTGAGLTFAPLASAVLSIGIVMNAEELLPVSCELFDNYPNPFNPATVIRFALPSESHVKLRVYSMSGEMVSELVNGTMQAGYQEISFNAESLASGVYFYSLEAVSADGKPFTAIKKMILLK